MVRRIVIDTDPGIDDAVAILLALAAPEEIEVQGIVAVAGNVPLAMAERNARRICELAGRADVPVHAGCSRPLLRPQPGAAKAHAEDGLGGLALPEPTMPLRRRHGVDFLIDALLDAEPGGVTLCALGPLTDIAMALVKAPEIAHRVGELVVMGGAGFGRGNVTPTAEFNIHVDPHAAAAVLDSGIPITMVPLDVTRKLPATAPRIAALRAIGNRCGAAAAGMLAGFRSARAEDAAATRGMALHDPCVIAYLLRPELFHGQRVNVAVETASQLTLGMTVVDWRGVTGRPANAHLLTEVDASGFYALLIDRLARLP
jgi:purine nucleosidase